MSEFTETGQRISARHHLSTVCRQVGETQVLDSTYNSESAAKNPHEHQQMLTTTPGTTTPPDHQSLPIASESPTMPFPSDQTTISHSNSTESQNTSPYQNLRQPDIESGSVADTSICPRDSVLNETTRLVHRISALEQQLLTERSTVTTLTSTLSQERMTFEERMLRMEKTVAQLSAVPPPPPPPSRLAPPRPSTPSATPTAPAPTLDPLSQDTRTCANTLNPSLVIKPPTLPPAQQSSTTSSPTTVPAPTLDPSSQQTTKTTYTNIPNPYHVPNPASLPPAHTSHISSTTTPAPATTLDPSSQKNTNNNYTNIPNPYQVTNPTSLPPAHTSRIASTTPTAPATNLDPSSQNNSHTYTNAPNPPPTHTTSSDTSPKVSNCRESSNCHWHPCAT